MKTRAKLTLESKNGTNVVFRCMYDPKNSPEDNTFSKYTPTGHAIFSITNEEVLNQLEVGKTYYFDISPTQ